MTEQITKLYNKLDEIYVLQNEVQSLPEITALQNSLNDIKQSFDILKSEIDSLNNEERNVYLTDIDILEKLISDTQKVLDEKAELISPELKYKKYVKYTIYGVVGYLLYKIVARGKEQGARRKK